MTPYTNDDNFKIRTTIGEITLIYNYMNITTLRFLKKNFHTNIQNKINKT